MRFKDAVAVVTGGGSGIGRASARKFSAQGATVAVVDVDAARAQAVADEIIAAGGQAMAIGGDVSDEESVRANVARIVERHGRIDILLSNAGASFAQPAVDYANWRRIMEINLDGMFYWARAAAIGGMMPQGRGAIVLVTSTAGLSGMAGEVGYVTSKHGLVGLVKALAIEWAPHGIRVNGLAPGMTDTPLTRGTLMPQKELYADIISRIPLGRIGEADEQASAALFLASHEASYITGAVLVSDGGQTALSSQHTGTFPPQVYSAAAPTAS